MTMRQEVREWWLELADQYEAWACSPPKDSGREIHTCCGLIESDFGWWRAKDDPCAPLSRVWKERWGRTEYPAGLLYSSCRDELREEFCLWMAERIREEVGYG